MARPVNKAACAALVTMALVAGALTAGPVATGAREAGATGVPTPEELSPPPAPTPPRTGPPSSMAVLGDSISQATGSNVGGSGIEGQGGGIGSERPRNSWATGDWPGLNSNLQRIRALPSPTVTPPGGGRTPRAARTALPPVRGGRRRAPPAGRPTPPALEDPRRTCAHREREVGGQDDEHHRLDEVGGAGHQVERPQAPHAAGVGHRSVDEPVTEAAEVAVEPEDVVGTVGIGSSLGCAPQD